MKRDLHLVEAILQCIEKNQKYWEVLVSSYEESEITQHAFMLNEEGFISGLTLKKCQGGGWKFIPSKSLFLTMSGHNFLDHLRG
jgi:hypothetical protein